MGPSKKTFFFYIFHVKDAALGCQNPGNSGYKESIRFDKWHPINLHYPQGFGKTQKDALLPLVGEFTFSRQNIEACLNLKMYDEYPTNFLACHASQPKKRCLT